MALTSNVKTGIYQKNLAGLDVAIDVDMTVTSESLTGNGYLSAWMNTQASGTGFWQYYLLTFNVDKDAGTYGIYWPDGGSWQAGVTKICDITPDEQFNVKIVFDFDGANAENYYVFINGTYYGSAKVISSCTQAGYNSPVTNNLAHQNTWAAELGDGRLLLAKDLCLTA